MAMSPESIAAHFREHERVGLHIEVTFDSDHNFFMGFTENVSEGGLFVATHCLRKVGTRMPVSFLIPGRAEPVCAIVEVRWLRTYSESSDAPPGMGLQFVQLATADAAAIRAFVDHRAPIFYE